MTGIEQIGVGVVGLGYFGSHHARHYGNHPSARLAAVVDADPGRAAEAAERHGAEPLGDHRQLIGKVSAASIAAPTSDHHAIARDLIEAGIHVFVEKPIAADVADAAELVDLADEHGVVLQVGHIERHSPTFRALRERVRSPRLIECVRHTLWQGRAIDVDVVLDLMIHDIDLALALADAPVESVTAAGVRVATDTCDIAEARLVFTNGAVATLSASRVASQGRRTVAVAEPRRLLTADLADRRVTIAEGGDGAVASEVLEPESADNLAAEIDGFLDSVRTGRPPLVDGRAGLEALKVADRILLAISGTDFSPSLHLDGVPA